MGAVGEALADALLEEHRVTGKVRARLLDKTEGNPLFVEETVRMLVEEGADGGERIPDSLQAMIGARIARLPAGAKIVLQRGSVIGRTFWAGAIDHLSPEYDSDELEDMLDDLLLRDFIFRETRSTISDESAYRFKHVLIREVAYSGLAKASRAAYHERFAEWLGERAGEELLEIRAYHLDQAVSLLVELDGEAPSELVTAAAAAPFLWPCSHCTGEPTVNASSTERPPSTAARRRGVARSSGRHGRIARPTATAGAK